MRMWENEKRMVLILILIVTLLLGTTTRILVTGLSTQEVALLRSLTYHDPFHSTVPQQRQYAVLAKFYRDNGSRLPRMKPGEVQYTLWQPMIECEHTNDNDDYTHDDDDDDDDNNNDSSSSRATIPIASLRMCPRYENDSIISNDKKNDTATTPTWLFLRALCVATSYRRQGWALQLLQRVISEIESTYHHHHHGQQLPLYLFADPSLSSLYHKAGFMTMMINNKQKDHDHNCNVQETTTSTRNECENNDLTTKMTNIPNSLRQRFVSMNRRLKSRGACLYCYGYIHEQRCADHDPLVSHYSNRRIHVMFLQHHKELQRKTGTAVLVQRATVENKNNLASYLCVSNFTWTGRADNGSLEQLLDIWRRNGRRVVLLWKGGTHNVTEFLPSGDLGADPPTFVLIDGTWQEAQTMFRKIASLARLPRIELQARNPSDYRLRSNFGWKERFGDGNADSLLCTVEVVAELLEQAGRVDGGKELRQHLKDFTLQLDKQQR